MSVKPTFEHTDSFCFALKKNFKMLFKRNFFIKKIKTGSLHLVWFVLKSLG